MWNIDFEQIYTNISNGKVCAICVFNVNVIMVCFFHARDPSRSGGTTWSAGPNPHCSTPPLPPASWNRVRCSSFNHSSWPLHPAITSSVEYSKTRKLQKDQQKPQVRRKQKTSYDHLRKRSKTENFSVGENAVFTVSNSTGHRSWGFVDASGREGEGQLNLGEAQDRLGCPRKLVNDF